MAKLTTTVCAECAEDLEHCHGAVLVHLDGTIQCTEDPDCLRLAVAHRFVLACTDEACCPGD